MNGFHKAIQYGAVALGFVLGILRLFNEPYSILIFLNCICFPVALFMLIFTMRAKLETGGILQGKIQMKLEKELNFCYIYISLLTIGIIVFCVQNWIPSKYGDMFAIFSLGISLGNDSFATFLIRLRSYIYKRHQQNPIAPFFPELRNKGN